MKKGIIAIVVILLLSLFFRIFFFFKNLPHFENGQHAEFTTTLFSEPSVSTVSQTFSLQGKSRERIMVRAPRYPEYHYGDILKISGQIKETSSKTSRLLKKNNQTILTMYFPKVEKLKQDNPALAVVSSIRQNVILLFQKSLPAVSSNLLLGITFGISQNFQKQFLQDLRVSGVLHVIAASGMNVTLTAGFLISIFGLFFKRQKALVFSIFGILFYAVFSGLSPSIVRASIMGIFAFSSQIVGRQFLPWYGLLLAGFLMLFISPILLFDVGFQLSFFSTLGLFSIGQLLGSAKKIGGENFTATISAQLATLPILLANFGMYSAWSVVVNLLVLWTVPVLMVIGGAGALVGLLFEPLGRLILYFSLPFLLYFEAVVSFFGRLGNVLQVNSVPWQFAVGYYLLLLSIILLRKR